MSKKIVIVGGVAGGASCAARLRRLDETAEIVMFEKGPFISFANCGLPYHISGDIKSRDHLLVQTPQGMMQRFKMSIFTETEVTSINRSEKTVTVTHLPSQRTWKESYDRLVLSPGAEAVVPSFTGAKEAANIFVLRTIPDMDAINHFIQTKQPQQATIIGGGFIGLEMAEALTARGIQVQMIEMNDQVMSCLDPEVAAEVHITLRENGVKLYLGDGVDHFENAGKTVVLKSGFRLLSDITILAIGVRPDTRLAKSADLAIGSLGGIAVNESFQTNDPDIYAIGDAIEVNHFITRQSCFIPLAGPANRQGRMVADHIAGKSVCYPGTLGTGIVKVFNQIVANTGINEKVLKSTLLPYQAIHIYPASHASYYPGASQLTLKVLYNPENGEIYGAQCVGKENVDKAIDTIVSAIMAKQTVYDLAHFELCYAPPFSSAKNPVNFVGYVAQNIRDGLKTAEWDEVDNLANQGAFILDVTTPKEHQSGHMPNAINIPVDILRDHLDKLPKDQPIYVHCAVGLRGYIASRILQQNGFDAINISGGYKLYQTVKRQHHVTPKTPQPNHRCQ